MSDSVLRADEWDDALATCFNGLRPAHADPTNSGRLAAGALGDLAMFHVAGSPQRLTRTFSDARRRPAELFKICIQRSGSALIRQAGHEVLLTAGSMAMYDLERPYSITLDGDWRSDVIAFPKSALVASPSFVAAALCRPTEVTDGPGAVLISLVSSGVERTASDPAAELMGRAGLDLIRAALCGRTEPRDPDAVRMQVEAYIQSHLADPGLAPATVAAAHHMSERSLHRLFGSAEHSVGELIRVLRLRAVRNELAATDEPIARLAGRWGYHDMPHFDRVFKAHYGMTPSEARRAGRT